MKKKYLIALIACCIMTNVFAADPVIKEETTPPVAEGAITPDQLQPYLNALNQNPTAPAPTQQPGNST